MKYKIIEEFNLKRKIFDAEYPHLDGTIYLNSRPFDPYGGKIDMPIEKFPQWHKYNREKDALFREYNLLILPLAKFKHKDIVVVSDEDSIEFGMIYNGNLDTINNPMNRYIGNYSEYDTDIVYIIKFEKRFDVWKYGSSGGSFGHNICICGFEEKYVVMKVTQEEMEIMKQTPLEKLKEQYPNLLINYKNRI